MTSRYVVVYERNQDAWLARVPSVPGCHTHGRSLNEAEDRIREALGLWVDDADSVELIAKIRLPGAAREAVRRGTKARRQARHAQERANAELAAATRTLARVGLSRRDAARLLGLSHQRIQQLTGRTVGATASGAAGRRRR